MHRAIVVSMMLTLAACPRAHVDEALDPNTASPDPSEQQRRAIAASVAGYVDALAANDPASASNWVVSATFDFYDQLRTLALTGARGQLEQHSLIEVVMILELRSRFTRAELEQTSGRQLFEQAIAAGMQAGSLPLDDIWIDESGSKAEVRVAGRAELWLAREQGRWCVDLPAMILGLAPRIEVDLGEMIEADGKLRVAFVLLEGESPRWLDIAILDGPVETMPVETMP